jgi:chemotaxis protein MotB
VPKDFNGEYEDSEDLIEFNDLHEDIDDYASSPMDSNGTWLVSYADLMTLIACFFIMMVAFANFDDVSFQDNAKNFAMYFRGDKVESKGESQKNIKTGPTDKVLEAQVNEVPVKPISKTNLYTHINENVRSASISEISPPKDIEVVFNGSAMFGPGKVDLSVEVNDSLEVMIDLIVARKKDFIVLFEGHTDDSDISNKVYPSNWELSAARAARILKKFETAGIPSDRLVAVGYGDSRPIYKNRDKDGKAIPQSQRLNRRVVIKVLYERDAAKEDLGLGVFFRDNKGKIIPSELNKEKD